MKSISTNVCSTRKHNSAPQARHFFLIQLLLVAGLLATGIAHAKIAGSAHDFSGRSWSGGEICIVCHTPHNANSTTGAPLWNRAVPDATSYQIYQSPTLKTTLLAPGPESIVCLSCHDGTLAVDSYGGGSGGSEYVTGSRLIGTDLRDDHPIGVEWKHQLQISNCGQCHVPPISPVRPNKMLLPFFKTGGSPARVECASCHDPHNGGDNPKLLRKAIAGSELCFHCHGK